MVGCNMKELEGIEMRIPHLMHLAYHVFVHDVAIPENNIKCIKGMQHHSYNVNVIMEGVQVPW